MEEKLQIRQMQGEAELAAVQDLCRAYRALLLERWPDFRPFWDRYYGADDYEALLQRLPEVHRAPEGAILVAEIDGQIVGCGMYYGRGEGLCEIKRVYVSGAARGHGAGRAICVEAMRLAHRAGYRQMVLDTTTRLPEAIALYESLGFRRIAPFYDPPADFAGNLLFYGADLTEG